MIFPCIHILINLSGGFLRILNCDMYNAKARKNKALGLNLLQTTKKAATKIRNQIRYIYNLGGGKESD